MPDRQRGQCVSTPWRGIFAIQQTPFDAAGNLVWADFEREAYFIARSGAHGFVWPVMASEFTVVSAEERLQGMRLAVSTVSKRAPVVIGVAETSTSGAMRFAAEAARCGADGVIAMPPWAAKMGSPALLANYYRAIAEASGLPVIIQNADGPLGSSLSAKHVTEICSSIPGVWYVKEEKNPQGHSVSELINHKCAAIRGVFSGASAVYLVPEHRRGVCGNMPGCVLPDVDARLWNLLEAGNARRWLQSHPGLLPDRVAADAPGSGRRRPLRRHAGLERVPVCLHHDLARQPDDHPGRPVDDDHRRCCALG